MWAVNMHSTWFKGIGPMAGQNQTDDLLLSYCIDKIKIWKITTIKYNLRIYTSTIFCV